MDYRIHRAWSGLGLLFASLSLVVDAHAITLHGTIAAPAGNNTTWVWSNLAGSPTVKYGVQNNSFSAIDFHIDDLTHQVTGIDVHLVTAMLDASNLAAFYDTNTLNISYSNPNLIDESNSDIRLTGAANARDASIGSANWYSNNPWPSGAGPFGVPTNPNAGIRPAAKSTGFGLFASFTGLGNLLAANIDYASLVGSVVQGQGWLGYDVVGGIDYYFTATITQVTGIPAGPGGPGGPGGPAAVPEPTSAALLGAALAGLFGKASTNRKIRTAM